MMGVVNQANMQNNCTRSGAAICLCTIGFLMACGTTIYEITCLTKNSDSSCGLETEIIAGVAAAVGLATIVLTCAWCLSYCNDQDKWEKKPLL